MWSNSAQPYAGGTKSPPQSLQDIRLLELIRHYRLAVAKQYRVLPFDRLEQVVPPGRLWLSPKIDGELWFLVRRGDEVALVAYNGRVLTGTPLLEEAARTLQAAGAGDLVLAGELFALPPAGRPRSFHVSRALGEAALAETLRFQPFDLIEDPAHEAWGGTDPQMAPYARRLARLEELLGRDRGERLRLVPTVEGEGADAVTYFREWVSGEKFEGLVLRNEQGIIFKIKPNFTIDAVIVAFGERVVSGATQMRELAVALRGDDGSFQLLGTVGSAFSDLDRLNWAARLDALVVPSTFRMANREGTLCRFVRPEIVIEIRCSDLLDVDADDVPIRRMALSYSPEVGYQPLGDRRIAAMLHPVFQRERTDKLPDVASAGLTQVTRRVALEEEPGRSPAASGATPPCTVRRGVWIKGPTAVRKYVILESPAEPDRPISQRERPPYLFFATDYSAGRAEPLKTTLRSASTLARAEQQAAAWREENIKKGWNEVLTSRIPAADPSQLTAVAEPPPAPVPAAKPSRSRKKKAEGEEA